MAVVFEQAPWAAIASRVGCEMIDPSQIATAELQAKSREAQLPYAS
jgi:hypothetical protein